MQPFIHQSGNEFAINLAAKAKETGVTTMFNDDPQVSVDKFDFYKKYSFFHPDTNKDDANAFATLVRECVHFEVETVASMLTFGLDLNLVYPQITLSYIYRSCRSILRDKYNNTDDAFAQEFARELVSQVYAFIKPKLDLPAMSWEGVEAKVI
ncbi:hypothetical protein DAPK24_010550 [Pichia kluyveri]|uniref:Uncharacterized protein n=1 Tax=Pichia kluyveri TaxID=36015 RepID=A0AAV5QZT3_PICKL|nr:hypothetical protein DAPK24_010550 [Pichia kluyveri]